MNRTLKTKLGRIGKSGSKRQAGSLDRAMKVKVAGGFLGMLAVMVGWAIFRSGFTNRQAIEQNIQSWRREYRLSAEQAARIRQIEESYHGTGSLLTRPTHSIEEIADHFPAISRVMNPEDGARFLKDQERIAKSRPRRIRAHAH